MIKGKLIPKIILIFIPMFIGISLRGQTLDVDTTKVENIEIKDTQEHVHSPHKATIYSALLPGLGQAYNKKYWKIPLVYAGFGTMGYFMGWNNDRYKIMRNAYSDLTDGDPNTTRYLDLDAAKYYDLDNDTERNNFATALSKQQDYYRRNRDLLIICTVGFYGLNIIDASVDAHFFDFDMSEDLTMNWQPTMQLINNQTIYGASCTFTF